MKESKIKERIKEIKKQLKYIEESDRQGLEYLYANEIKYYRKTDRETYIKTLYDVVDILNFCQMIYETTDVTRFYDSNLYINAKRMLFNELELESE